LYPCYIILYTCTCARPVAGLRFELKIMTTNNGDGGLWNAGREGENEYHILYSNILILLCEIVLPIIMLKCRILIIIIIIRSSSSIHRWNIIHTSYAFIFILYTRLHRCVCIKTCLSNGDGRRTILLLLAAAVHTKV